MHALTIALVRLSLWQLRLLARLLARYDLPWLLAQDVVELSADDRADLVALLMAWQVGKRGTRRTRGTRRGHKAVRPGTGDRQRTRGA